MTTTPTRSSLRAKLLTGRCTLGVAAVATMALVAAGCGTSGGSSDNEQPGASGFQAPDIPMKTTKVAQGEGELNVLAWPGYAESGKNDPKVDWVTPFEQQTGCKVNVREFGTSDEAVSLMHSGGYDVVSASGDATLRLIAAGDVQPINTDLVPNYQDISSFLKDQSFNSVNGQMWGIPHGWGANLLMYNTDVVKPAPTDWGAVFDGSSAYSGRVTAYDSPIYIADAALYLMNTKPDLGIKNPYALDKDQLAAAVAVLKNQKANIGEYWSDYTKEVQAFKTGSTVIGTTWQVIANLAQADAPVATVFPDERLHGLVGHLDGLVEDEPSQLRVRLAELDREPEGAGPGRGVVRRGARQPEGVRLHGPGLLRPVPRDGRGLCQEDLVLDDAHLAVPGRSDRRDVHGLQRLDRRLDRGQGLT